MRTFLLILAVFGFLFSPLAPSWGHETGMFIIVLYVMGKMWGASGRGRRYYAKHYKRYDEHYYER